MAVRLDLIQGSPEWLAARSEGIGASDVPVIMGDSPYKSPYQLWAEKTGRVEPETPDPATAELMEIGKLMEPVLLELYERRTGRKPRRAPRMLAHPDLPWARASLDAEAPKRRIVEGKWTHARRWNEDDAVPVDVLEQGQWQLFVTGWDVVDIVALVGPQLRIVEVPRDQSMIDDLLYVVTDFWTHVQDRTPPLVDGSEATRRAIARIHPVDDGHLLPATDELVDLVDHLRDAKAAAKAAKEAEDTIANALRAVLGDASGIDGLVTYRKNADSTRVNWPAVAAAYRELLEGKVPSEDLDVIESTHSMTSPGPRVLRLSKGASE